MQIAQVIFMALVMVLSFSAASFAQDGSPSGSQDRSTKIVLTIGGKEYPAVLYDNVAARELKARLPLTVSLNRGGRDYCGDIPALKYDEAQVQNGYRNGQLAYWIPGQDFVIFIEKEESGANVNGVVVLGEISVDFQPLFSLGRSVQVGMALAE